MGAGPGLELARRLAAELAQAAEPCTILLGGSVARGAADGDSDLDLLVLTPGPLPPELRHAWARRVADAGTALFLDQPVRTGGVADTLCASGWPVTVHYRRVAQMDRGVADLVGALVLDRDHETAFGHEPAHAMPLHDPGRLLDAWRKELSTYPVGRCAAVQGRVAARCATRRRLAAPEDAVMRLVPAAGEVVHAACAAAGTWYPGAKWHGLRLLEGASGATVLERVSAVLSLPGRLPERVAELAEAGLQLCGGPAAAVGEEEAEPAVDPLQLLNAGADAVGGRMLVARRRGDPFAFAHYAHRAAETAALLRRQLALEPAPGPWLAAFELGFAPSAMAEVQARLVEVWSGLLAAVAQRRPELPTAYAAVALEVGRRKT